MSRSYDFEHDVVVGETITDLDSSGLAVLEFPFDSSADIGLDSEVKVHVDTNESMYTAEVLDPKNEDSQVFTGKRAVTDGRDYLLYFRNGQWTLQWIGHWVGDLKNVNSAAPSAPPPPPKKKQPKASPGKTATAKAASGKEKPLRAKAKSKIASQALEEEEVEEVNVEAEEEEESDNATAEEEGEAPRKRQRIGRENVLLPRKPQASGSAPASATEAHGSDESLYVLKQRRTDMAEEKADIFGGRKRLPGGRKSARRLSQVEEVGESSQQQVRTEADYSRLRRHLILATLLQPQAEGEGESNEEGEGEEEAMVEETDEDGRGAASEESDDMFGDPLIDE